MLIGGGQLLATAGLFYSFSGVKMRAVINIRLIVDTDLISDFISTQVCFLKSVYVFRNRENFHLRLGVFSLFNLEMAVGDGVVFENTGSSGHVSKLVK